MEKIKITKKFRNAALSTVCIFALLSNTAAQAFTAQEFFIAAQAGDVETLNAYVLESRQLLAQHGGGYAMNLDIRDARGDTPLMKAAASGHVHVVDYLVRNGANLAATNYNGQTAYNLAMQNSQLKVAEYILGTSVQGQQMAANPYANPQMPSYPPQRFPAAPTPSAESTNWSTPILGTIAAAAAVGGGIALASGGGGSSSKGGGGGGGGGIGNPVQSGLTDSGGSTGIGSTHPTNGDPTTTLTTEANGQEGYAKMNTHYAAAHGYDGRIYMRNQSTGLLLNDTADGYIKVAVLDTGVDLNHPDLDANILVGDAVNCTTSGCTAGGDDDENSSILEDDDGQGHGTFVAGIIAAERDGGGGVNMQGIAPQAKILPIAFLNEYNNSGDYIGSDIAGLQYAVAQNAHIINASYALLDDGSLIPGDEGKEIPIVSAEPRDPSDPDAAIPFSQNEIRGMMQASEAGSNYLNVFRDMVANDTVIVWAAGNDGIDEVALLSGLPYYFNGNVSTANPNGYDWSKNWVTVVSLQNGTNTLSDFSNECGVAKNWCIAAPGQALRSTLVDGGYGIGSGTSFAAPNVSGALAVIMGAFPHFSPQEAVQLMFDTATDLGDTGVDEVFGHGLVNLRAATEPTTGGWNIATGPTSFGNLTPLAASNFSLAPAFGDGLSSLGKQNIMFIDGHRRDYKLPLSNLIHSKVIEEDKLDVMEKFGGSNLPEIHDVGAVKFGYTQFSGRNYGTSDSKGAADNTGLGKLYVAADLPVMGHVVNASFSNNVSVADVETTGGKTSLAENSLGGSFRNQFLNLSDNAHNVSFGMDGSKVGARIGYYSSERASDFDAMNFDRMNDVESKGIYSTVSYRPDNKKALFLQSGMNMENGSFLGSRSNGALSLSPESKTYFTSLSYEHSLTGNLTFLGNYSLGMTDLGINQNSLISNVTNAVSDSFAVGLEYSNIFSDDKFGLSFSQPLRVRNASADIRLPVDIMGNGDISYDNIHTSIAPEGRELDLQGYYSAKLDADSKLLFGSILRSEPDNVKDADNEALFVTKYSTKF